MSKRCPKGVLCIENITMFYILLLIILGIITYYKYVHKKIINFNYLNNFTPPFNYNNVLENKHIPPLKNNNMLSFNMPMYMNNAVPINVKTRGYDDTYRQVGILTRLNGRETILPLMGKPLHSNRGKWQYYTMTDQNNAIKLPISKNGKSCTGEYGCNEYFNGDSVYVEGYHDVFKVTVYENDNLKYIPI